MKTPPTSDLLAAWRAHFSVETQRRGEQYARAGRIELLLNDGARVKAAVRGQSGRYTVELDLRSQRVGNGSCTCLGFATSGACKHVWAVLSIVLAGLVPDPEEDDEAEPQRLGSWLAGLQRLERAQDGAAAEAPPEGTSRIDYVLCLDHERAARATVLETLRAKPVARGGFGKASPFALLAPRKDVQLGEADRRLAALLRGAGSTLFADLPRTENELFLDAEQTRALLPHLAATGRLFWKVREQAAPRPLVLDEGPPWRPCLMLNADEQGALRLTARLERRGAAGTERVDADELRGVLAGDFAVLDERIVPVRLGRGRAWFLLHAHVPPPPFSRREAQALLHELARRELDVEPGPDMEALIEARRPVPHLVLGAPRREGGTWSEVVGTVELDYAVGRVAATDRRPLLPTGRGVLRRYFEVEEALLAKAVALGARAGAPGTLALPLGELAQITKDLSEAGWVIEGEGARVRPLGIPRISVSSGVDWFEIEGRFEGLPAGEFPRLLAALRRGESSVLLGDGTTGILPEEWVARWRAALLLGETKDGRLRFRSSQAWFVDLLLEEFVDRESQRLWSAQRERLASFERIQPVQEPRGFHGELRPYQREGLGWLEFLERQRFGGCLADDMGLGKTVQVLAWLQARKVRDPRAAPALIVAPKSLTHNWLEEARRFTPELSVLEYVGPERKKVRGELLAHDLVLTTYGSVRIDVEFLAGLALGVVVLDEAQAIKNEGSHTARAVRLLTAEHRLALSGTPIENHLGELWSLFEFLNPGLLGRSSTFQALVTGAVSGAERPETGDEPEAASLIAPDEGARNLIARAVRPFLLRRTKEGVLRDLPERSEQTVLCDMEPAQKKEYAELRDHFRRTLLEKKTEAELQKDKLGILEMLLRLRQAACHPGLLDATRADDSCAKFDALFPMLEDVLESDHKALVFSQFTSFLALLRRRLDADGRDYGYLDGKTTAKKRTEEVARFQQDPTRKLFLVSLKAGGTGLNLTAADYVVLLDPWWNPAVEAQAIARSHRIGQERNVFAYRLVCRDTIEERVLELQEKKRELAAAILEADSAFVRDLTRADLERLLT
jgi:superfamily II DNA or RNA helicase